MSTTGTIQNSRTRWREKIRRTDPRWFQVLFLSLFLGYVLLFRGFTMSPGQMAVAIGGSLAVQACLLRALGLGDARIGYLSPLISSLSLCLLLRANGYGVVALAAVLTIGSKFAIRVRGKHVFNPTNFGILMTVLLTSDAWIATSQWGTGLLLVAFLGALGGMIVGKIGRTDIVVSFLAAHFGLRLLRVWVLGHTFDVFLHQALSGAVILFAFFMISDPKSTPDSRSGRILFAIVLAAGAYVLRFRFFWNDAVLWALLFASPLTPVLDLVWRSARFEWRDGALIHDEDSRSEPELTLAHPSGA